MAEKVLIMDSDHKNGTNNKFLQILVGNDEDETLYSEFQSIDDETGEITYDTHELAVHVNDLITIRDFCNKLISKIGPAGEYTDNNILIKLEEN